MRKSKIKAKRNKNEHRLQNLLERENVNAEKELADEEMSLHFNRELIYDNYSGLNYYNIV
jgi:hypothetical protein